MAGTSESCELWKDIFTNRVWPTEFYFSVQWSLPKAASSADSTEHFKCQGFANTEFLHPALLSFLSSLCSLESERNQNGVASHPNSKRRVRESSRHAGPSNLISLAEGNLSSAVIATPALKSSIWICGVLLKFGKRQRLCRRQQRQTLPTVEK